MPPSCFLEVDLNVMAKISELYHRTEDSLNHDVTTLKKWMETQPHLPEIMSDKSLQNLFVLCKCSIEKAKQRIDMYYTIRDKIPDIYDNINPKSLMVEEAMNIAYYLPLPKMTRDMYRVIFFKLRTKCMQDNLDFCNLTKVFLNTSEIRLNEDVMLGDVCIFDMSGLTFGFVTKLSLSSVNKALLIYEKIFSLPLKGVYFLNSPPFIEIVITILKKLLKPKLFNRVHVCHDESILAQHFPKEIFPKDYGGEEKSLEELQQLQKQKFIEYEERFDHLDILKVDESRRPVKLKNDEVLGFYGNFKKLDLD